MTRTKALLALVAVIALSAAYADWRVFALTGRVGSNQDSDTRALCAFRGDLAHRVQSTNDFLRTHPRGIPGIPASTFRLSVSNSQRSLSALSPLKCPAPKKEKSQ